MLDRVADLVGGDRDGGDRAAGVDLLREVDGAVPRVVVIRERAAGRGVHGNACEAVVLEDHQRDLLAAHPVRNRDLHLLADGLLQPVLDHQPDDQRRNQEDEVEAEATHIRESYLWRPSSPTTALARAGAASVPPCIFEVTLLYIG